MKTDHYKEKLLAQKDTLEKEMESIGRRNPHNSADFEAIPGETGKEADIGDQAEVLESYAENAATLSELEIRYSSVTGALARIENGTYGVCSECGEKIEEDRLEANPSAATCKAHL